MPILAQICPPKRHPHPFNFFCEFYLYLMLDIVASYHCMQFQGQTNDPKPRKWRKTSFLPQNLFPQKYSFISHQISWAAIFMYNIRKKLMIQS